MVLAVHKLIITTQQPPVCAGLALLTSWQHIMPARFENYDHLLVRLMLVSWQFLHIVVVHESSGLVPVVLGWYSLR